ncbi:MAG: YicC/YloC family endoribonuclease [bacterium]
MLKSMSGFGIGKYKNSQVSFTIELMSVNHRYCEVSVSKEFSFYELEIKKVINNYVKKGKVNINIFYEDLRKTPYEIKVDTNFIQHLEKISKKLKLKFDLNLTSLLTFPNLIKIERKKENEKIFLKNLKKPLVSALQNLVKTRLEEGKAIEKALCSEINKIEISMKLIENEAPSVITNYKKKLYDCLKEISKEEITQERIKLEIAILTDKIDIMEEITRIKSLLKQFQSSFEKDEPVGKNLGFLTIELLREINTISSKISDLKIKDESIKIKNSLETIKEQIQNIE